MPNSTDKNYDARAEARANEDAPLTRAEVQELVNNLVDSLKKILSEFDNKFAEKGAVNSIHDAVMREIGNRHYVNVGNAKDIATALIPNSLRNLDSDVRERKGDTLRLNMNPAGDSAYWGMPEPTPFPRDSRVFFGYNIDPGAAVRIYAGEIDRIAVAQTDVTVINNDFVYVRRTIADDTMEILKGQTVPDDDDTYKYYKLYQFKVTGVGTPPVQTASVLKYCRILAIEGGEGGGGFDWSKVSLGFTTSGTTVTILTGTIDRITVAQADVTVADDNFVYVRRTIADDTMLVVASVSVPDDDATYKYYRLYQFSVTGGVVAMKFALRPFDIESGDAIDTTNKTQYMVYQITDGTTTPPTAGFDWERWV